MHPHPALRCFCVFLVACAHFAHFIQEWSSGFLFYIWFGTCCKNTSHSSASRGGSVSNYGTPYPLLALCPHFPALCLHSVAGKMPGLPRGSGRVNHRKPRVVGVVKGGEHPWTYSLRGVRLHGPMRSLSVCVGRQHSPPGKNWQALLWPMGPLCQARGLFARPTP